MGETGDAVEEAETPAETEPATDTPEGEKPVAETKPADDTRNPTARSRPSPRKARSIA
jgi:hypothetical protein